MSLLLDNFTWTVMGNDHIKLKQKYKHNFSHILVLSRQILGRKALYLTSELQFWLLPNTIHINRLFFKEQITMEPEGNY